MNRVVMMGQADVNNWKDKWIQEGAKCDGIKRECLQVCVCVCRCAVVCHAVVFHACRACCVHKNGWIWLPKSCLKQHVSLQLHPSQIVIKCEQRVTALQQEHLAEMSKRDLMLQRAKDTIVRLEAHLAGGL